MFRSGCLWEVVMMSRLFRYCCVALVVFLAGCAVAKRQQAQHDQLRDAITSMKKRVGVVQVQGRSNAQLLEEILFRGGLCVAHSCEITVPPGTLEERLNEGGFQQWSSRLLQDEADTMSEPEDSWSATVRLVILGRQASVDEAVKTFKQWGMRPATLAELIAFDARYRQGTARIQHVVALGSRTSAGAFPYSEVRDVEGQPTAMYRQTVLLRDSPCPRDAWFLVVEDNSD